MEYVVRFDDVSKCFQVRHEGPLSFQSVFLDLAKLRLRRPKQTYWVLRDISFNVRPGEMLGVSLVWQAQGPVEHDYTVGVYLMNPSGTILLQHDRQPVAGFAPMTDWIPSVLLRDNYGFLLPDELSPGMHQIWIVVYDPQELERLSVMTEGFEVVDYLVLENIPVEIPASE